MRSDACNLPYQYWIGFCSDKVSHEPLPWTAPCFDFPAEHSGLHHHPSTWIGVPVNWKSLAYCFSPGGVPPVPWPPSHPENF